MTSPLSPEAVAQMVARLQKRGHHLRSTWDDGDMEFTAADMLTTLAAENATLRAERDTFRAVLDGAGYPVDDIAANSVEKSFALGQHVAALTIAIRSERDALRASEAAALERVKVLDVALREVMSDLFYQIEAKHGARIAREYPSQCQARAALTPTADKE